MAKYEEAAPWATTEAASREPYPRKNLYFVGDGQDEVYDYCIWRANVHGYETLAGDSARSSSEMINDILKRAYLRDMLDQEKADGFKDWRTKQYERGGLNGELATSSLLGKYHAKHAVPQSRRQDLRFRAFTKARDNVESATRAAVWQRQRGCCANCGAMRPLKIDVIQTSSIIPAEAENRREGGNNLENFVALCAKCHAKTAPSSSTALRSRQQFRGMQKT